MGFGVLYEYRLLLLRFEMNKLKRPELWIENPGFPNHTNQTYEVRNPATGHVIARVPCAAYVETQEAIGLAQEAMATWKMLTAKSRGVILQNWFKAVIDNADDLATILTLEQGKPFAEAKGEVIYAASFIEWFAEEGKRIYGDEIPSHKQDARIIVTKEPIGVVAAITPWNFPLAMVTRKLAPALAAGCSAILKPSEETPLSAHALLFLAKEAGVPQGVLQCLSGNAEKIGAALMDSKVVRKISFTGSTRVGQLLAEQSAKTLKKVSLELGGNAPFIVFEDADLDAAVSGAMASKFRNTGQTCVCVNRFYIHDSIYEQFVEKFKTEVAKLKPGEGFGSGVTQGPLINQAALNKVKDHVEQALSCGAKLIMGGKPANCGELFFEPTILGEATLEMKMAHEETFGPVAALYRFKSDSEVIEKANNTDYGLAAYFYSQNHARIWRVAKALEVGMIGINEGMISTEIAPFGGVKYSGMGREGSKYGINDYLELKYLLLGGINFA